MKPIIFIRTPEICHYVLNKIELTPFEFLTSYVLHVFINSPTTQNSCHCKMALAVLQHGLFTQTCSWLEISLARKLPYQPSTPNINISNPWDSPSWELCFIVSACLHFHSIIEHTESYFYLLSVCLIQSVSEGQKSLLIHLRISITLAVMFVGCPIHSSKAQQGLQFARKIIRKHTVNKKIQND